MTEVIRGKIVTEPEIRYTREGVAEGRIVVIQPDVPSSIVPATIEVVTRAELAENVVLSLSRGMEVIVMGAIVGGKLEAVDVGPSLRDAVCEVTRYRRRGDDVDEDAQSEGDISSDVPHG